MRNRKRKINEISTDDVVTPQIDPCRSQTIPVMFNNETIFNIDSLLGNMTELKEVLNNNRHYTVDFIIGDGAHTLDFDLTEEEVKEINSNLNNPNDLPVVKEKISENILNFFNQYKDRIRGLDGTFIRISSAEMATTLFKPDLEQLALLAPEFENNTSLTFIELIKQMTKLQRIGIISPIFKEKESKENYEKLLSTIQNHPSITDLQVCINTKYNVESLFNKPVKHLTIYYKMEPDNFEMKLNNIEALFNNSNLLRLDLHLNPVAWSASGSAITNVIQKHPTLEYVTVDDSTPAILNTILQNKRLKGLTYSGESSLCMDNLSKVTETITGHPSLKSLSIKDVNSTFGDHTVNDFLNTVVALPKLNEFKLDLPSALIDPETLNFTTSKLTTLNISGCFFQNIEASNKFFEKIRENRNLIFLNPHYKKYSNSNNIFFNEAIITNKKNYKRRLSFQIICVLISFIRANPTSRILNSILPLINYLIMPFCNDTEHKFMFSP